MLYGRPLLNGKMFYAPQEFWQALDNEERYAIEVIDKLNRQ